MPSSLLLRLCSQQAQTLVEWLRERPQAVQFRPDYLAETIQGLAAYTHLLVRADRCLWAQAASNETPHQIETDLAMVGWITWTLAECKRVQQAVRLVAELRHIPQREDESGRITFRLERPGDKVDRAEDLEQAITTLEKLLDTHRKSWPRGGGPTREEALTIHGRGESLDPDDAFSQIAGISREEWIKRADEHRRKLSQHGQGEE